MVGYLIADDRGQLFRAGLFQFMTSFALPWYAIVGAKAAVEADVPVLGAMVIAIVGPTAGRYFIDVALVGKSSANYATAGHGKYS